MPYRGLVNFRDAGGHRTGPATRMRAGALFRSGRLDLATRHDAEYLHDELGVRTVIDLRTTDERTASGPAELYTWHPDITEHHVPLFDRLGTAPTDTAVLRRHWAPSNLGERYARMMQLGGRHRLIEIINVILHSDGPCVIHCWSGKDRTGVVVASLQAIAGVDDEAIAGDYAATADWFAAHLDDHPELQVAPLRAAYEPQPATMLDTLAALRQRFGSIEAMLGGLDDDRVRRLRTWLTEPIQ